ncbi:flagellar biosynthesis protein FlhB [Thalassococcus profundi]|uniref:Flagellar biosynthesis protein FlhB n=1 Tax=Thalassococcus profundi TaxID=2282382 RepID=A0A369TSE8_9RHOB|nr:flagellar type III secretion system protein FlhB [Thalassococcus profundi]RDD68209.1 flagellar biosynthesis protein FlhB [Thalassococcus profundi]
MSESDDTEKTHEPSPHKLEEARKKGEIARSPDTLVAVGYAGMAMIALMLGKASLTAFGDALLPLIDHPERLVADFFDGPSDGPTAALAGGVLTAVLPWFLVPGILVLATLLATRGLLFTPSKLAFKGSRLSLIQNAKNKFGRGGLFEFAKSFTKLAVYSAALALFLTAYMSEIVGSPQAGPGPVLALFGHLTLQFLAVVVVIAAAIGTIDFVWQRHEHLRKNRMSHKELRDEFKNTEGDPEMKHERRQRGQEIAMNRMMADVPKASVIIVNPTHYAVALKWDRGQGGAPVCLAKGVDAVAVRIREAAQEAGIPIHEDPPTARSLYASVDIGQQIAPDLYRPVAAAIRFAEDMRQKAKRGVWR